MLALALLKVLFNIIAANSLKDSYIASGGTNCFISQKIDTREDCEFAGLQLGYYSIKKVSRNDRPIGCYWDLSFTEMGFFNSIQNTSTSFTNANGGICGWKQGWKYMDIQ